MASLVLRASDAGWRQKSQALQTALEPAAAAAVEKAAGILESRVKDNLSGGRGLSIGFETGRLFASIENLELGPASRVVRQNSRIAFYGRMVEFGSHNQDGSWHVRPRPFFGDAVRDSRQQMIQELDRGLRDPIRHIGMANV